MGYLVKYSTLIDAMTDGLIRVSQDQVPIHHFLVDITFLFE